jgi:oxalate decarboxylase
MPDDHPHLYRIAATPPNQFEGGTLQGATEQNWKLLSGQNGSVYLARLQPGGAREPHWHPSGWEFNYVVAGKAKWSIVGPKATQDQFEAGVGDLVFVPQGHFHYFENASDTTESIVLIVFNTSMEEPDDDIGILASLSAIPSDALAAVFKTPQSFFDNLPKRIERITIARKPR